MSTPSELPKPVPETVTAEVGGPVIGESSTAGTTVKLVELVAVPPGVVTVMGPVEAVMAGTVAVIREDEFTVNTDATPWNFTAVAPVNADPLMVTFVPAAPEVGLKALMVSVTPKAGAAGASTPRHKARPSTGVSTVAVLHRSRRSTLVAI